MRAPRRLLRHKQTGTILYESDGLVGNTDYEPVEPEPEPALEDEPQAAPELEPPEEVTLNVRRRPRGGGETPPDASSHR